jgi:uncharacterized protein (TIGR00288 family)
MKKTAVLIDLGFALNKLYRLLGNRNPTSIEVRDFALRCINADEELFRIYCYHCSPYGEQQTHPLTRVNVDFSTTPTYISMSSFIRQLKLTDNVAFRSGELSFDGWTIKKFAAKDIIRTGRALAPDDFAPDLKQKGVDMKIGLDVAWLASKRIVDRIVLVTADSDFIPAMKFARREGIQVILVTMGHAQVKQELKVHADELRSITYP